jgi:beta-lactamase regulating signal transducer with metallopeptidase domain
MLVKVFTAVLNMSLTATIAATLIIIIRLIFNKKLPKSFSYALWAVVLVRLLIPFSISSVVSIFNVLPSPAPAPVMTTVKVPAIHNNAQKIGTLKYVSDNIVLVNKPSVETGGEVIDVDKTVGGSLPAVTTATPLNPMQLIMVIISLIWALGAAGLLIYCLFAYITTAKKLQEAVLYKESISETAAGVKLNIKKDVRIFTSDRIDTPVVYGLLKPRIILPLLFTQNADDKALQFIYSHELSHIKRFDYIIKPISVLALCIHWFNPMSG